MARYHIIHMLLLMCFHLPIDGFSIESYMKERRQFVDSEESSFLGESLVLSEKESQVNGILMSAKQREYNDSFKNQNFPPSRHFFRAKCDIENSAVFGIIRNMPKGAALHGHDTAMASVDFLVQNVTYRDNLYMCMKSNGKLLLHFFQTPDSTCNWTLVSDERSKGDPNAFDEALFRNMTLEVPNPEEVYPDINAVWSTFETIFGTVNGMVLYAPVFRDYYYEILRELLEDNVMYLELRGVLPPVYELDGTVHTAAEILGMYKEVTDKFLQEHPKFLGARFIYAPYRVVDAPTVGQYVQTAIALRDQYGDFLAGFDLVGQEDKGGRLLDFVEELAKLPENMKKFFHAGETNWEGLTDENLIDAILLNTTRIGHGYAITKHPLVLKTAKERNVAIELNPISNQVLLLVNDLRNHPAASLLAEDFPLVVSCDDPSFWGAKGLSYDFYETFMGIAGLKADLRMLKQLALNSLKYSAIPDDEKTQAKDRWTEDWNKFLDYVLQTKESLLNHESRQRQLKNGKCVDV